MMDEYSVSDAVVKFTDKRRVETKVETGITEEDIIKPLPVDQFINYIMAQSKNHVLIPVLITEAIRNYTETYLKEVERPTEHGDGFISAISWYETIEEVNRLMKVKYESNEG